VHLEIERELALRAGAGAATSAQIAQLAGLARVVAFASGEPLCTAGATTDRLYLVMEGEVELPSSGAPSWHATPGTLLGVLDALMDRRCARTAIARTDVRALEIHVDDYLAFLSDNVDLCLAMIAELAAGLHRAMLGLRDPTVLFDGAGGPPARLTKGGGLAVVDRLLLLQRVPAFRRATVQALASLAARAEVEPIEAGVDLFEEGDPSDTIWIVARGRVHLVRQELTVPLHRGPSQLVTHLAELALGPREFTAITTERSVLLRIHREDLLDRLDEHFELARSILGFLAGERARLNDLLAERGNLRLSRA
jgi:CRP-like cAMP-binding protein